MESIALEAERVQGAWERKKTAFSVEIRHQRFSASTTRTRGCTTRISHIWKGLGSIWMWFVFFFFSFAAFTGFTLPPLSTRLVLTRCAIVVWVLLCFVPINILKATNNAVDMSNTFFMDRCLGWRGICVEADPMYHLLIREQRTCALVPTCVSDRIHDVQFISALGLGGISSTNKNFKDFVKDGSLSQKAKYNLTCTTVGILTKAAKVDHIDYLSLDVEGHELRKQWARHRCCRSGALPNMRCSLSVLQHVSNLKYIMIYICFRKCFGSYGWAAHTESTRLPGRLLIPYWRHNVCGCCADAAAIEEVLRGIDWDAVTIDVMTVEMNGGKEKTDALVSFLSHKNYSLVAEGSQNRSASNGNVYKLEYDSAFVHQRIIG